jgi:hypothetical protein
MGSLPKLFLRFGLDLKLLWLGQSIKQQASSSFLECLQNGILVVFLALVLLPLIMVSLALPSK